MVDQGARGTGLSPNIIGGLFMIGSMAAFSMNDTLIKLTDGDLPLWQLLFLRGLLTIVLILALGSWLGALHFRMSRRDWFWIGARSVSEIGAAYFIITALLALPLANVTAILQMMPLTVSLAAAVFLGEALGWRRLVAILVGFSGMLLIVRPGPEGFDLMSLYAVAAVVFVTARDITTRKMSKDVPSLTITFAASLCVTIYAGAASSFQGWAPVTSELWWLICGAAFTIVAAYTFSVQTMRYGEIGFIAPFRYTALIWALLFGWLVFGDWPDALTFVGAGIIVATGLFTFWREQRSK